MSMIDRYVYAVTKGLPQKQRGDIDKELRTLIDDMLEQYQEDEPYEKKIQRVLMGLGDPELLSDSYREAKRYLIGPQNFQNYIFILQIVLGAVFLGISVSTVIESFSIIPEGIISIFVNYAATLFSALMQGFAWVTISFAIAEYNGVRLLDKRDIREGWSIEDLPELPEKKAAISKGETIFSIVFSTIFISALFFDPKVFAAYININTNPIAVIPVFNVEILSRFKMLLVVIFIVGIIKEALKLYYGRWTMKLSIPLTFLSIISAIITVSLFANPNIWNADFAQEVMKHLGISISGVSIWNSIRTEFIIVVLFATIIDVATSLYKGIKYNN